MHEICRQWIVDVLKEHEQVVAIAIRQRAKLEGWLKFELAVHAERQGFGPVSVEQGYEAGRSDVTVYRNGQRFDIELKTATTNWRMSGVLPGNRPITKNIDGIIDDARKLFTAPGKGIVAFLLLPIPHGDERWIVYLTRIAETLGIHLSEDEHCSRVDIRLGTDDTCEVIVCCFPFPSVPSAVSSV